MDIEKNLILVKGEDKTDQIIYCKYDSGKWWVCFYNNPTKYSYSYRNVEWYRNPKSISYETCIVYENNQPLSGIIKILDFGEYVRIFFKGGYNKVYKRSNILIEETCTTNSNAYNCFEYLKKLAYYTGIKTEDDVNLLSKQYSELTVISPCSALAAYLMKKPLRKEINYTYPIFPFGFNLSQKSATEKALSNQMSVIEGPPGTGKTQTILNVIANAIVNNKTVAVVSNNNSATSNVLEKLEKYGVDFIAAYLGNKDNKEIFFSQQRSTYPDMSNWFLPHQVLQSIRKKLFESQQLLNKMLEYKNKLALLKNELSSLRTENKYFEQYYAQANERPLKLRSVEKLEADRILSLLIDYKYKAEKGKFSLAGKLYNLIFYGIYNLSFYNNNPDIIISFLQKTYYEKKINEIKNEIDELENKLRGYNFEKTMKEYSETSMRMFKAKLAERYQNRRNRPVFSDEVLKRDFNSFIKEYPVILSTTHSLRSCIEKNYLFDYVIVDEASQVDLVTGALALSCARNAVIVGDLKQLPNVISAETEKYVRQIFDSFQLESAYSYADNSLLSSIINLYKDVPRTLLKEHYRCHPKIIGFCNQKFYNGQLIILTNEKENDKPLALYKTAKGNHARGKLNQRQIDAIFEEIFPQQNIDETKQSVGIVSPYRLQADEIMKVIGGRNIEVDTVHKYQGREKDVIILTTVANQVGVDDFVDNPNLINVAVSRAVNKLIVVVSDTCDEWRGTNIGDLVRYIQYNNFEIIESQVYSVFDLLYSRYSEKLLDIIKNCKKVSKYASENFMNAIVEKVVREPEFQTLDYVMHQPLKMLIKDPSKLNDYEYKFAMNILTHTDFLIFNKIDKMPVLVVEVDGYAFHANNPKQLERDKMKDDILQKYNIPIIRIKTNESGEERRLRQKLTELLDLQQVK